MDEHYKLETPFGVAWITVTQGNHLVVDANHNCAAPGIEAYPKGSRMGPLVINGVEIGAHAHLYLWKDGKWHIGPEFTKQDNGELKPATDYERRQSLYMSKIHAKNYNDIPSDSARRKVANSLPGLVNEWAKDNQLAIYEAEVKHLEDEVAKAQEHLLEATALADKADDRVLELQRELQHAEVVLGRQMLTKAT